MKVEIVEKDGKWYWVVFTDAAHEHSIEGVSENFQDALREIEGVVR